MSASGRPASAQNFYAPLRPKIGFIFIGAGWCPYCKRAAPVLARLADESAIPVLVVSLDGRPIGPFTDVVHDPGHPLVGQSPHIPRTMLVELTDQAILGSFDGFKTPGSYARSLRLMVGSLKHFQFSLRHTLSRKAREPSADRALREQGPERRDVRKGFRDKVCLNENWNCPMIIYFMKKMGLPRLSLGELREQKAVINTPRKAVEQCGEWGEHRVTQLTLLLVCDLFMAFVYPTLFAIFFGISALNAQTADQIGQSSGFCADGIQTGWHFYCDPEPEESQTSKIDTKQPEIAPPAETPSGLKKKPAESAMDRLARFNALVEEKKALAILEPTHANLVAYMSIQKEMIDRAENFQKQWAASLYQTPELDHNAIYPLTNPGVFDYQDNQTLKEEVELKKVAQSHVIMYVHERPEICFTCKTQSAIIATLLERQDIPIFVVSKDGYRYPEFPEAEIDHGNLKGLGLDTNPTPFIALINPKGGDVKLLGHGLVTEDQIIARIFTVMNPKKIKLASDSIQDLEHPQTPPPQEGERK